MIYIANWKMQLPFIQERKLAQEYLALAPLTQHNSTELVLCPSFPSLNPIQTIISGYQNLILGAQDCSSHPVGPYTGQVSAQSLAEVGCSYCIVGHSERRTFETDEQIAQKVIQLTTNKIIPVICIGEAKDQYTKNETISVIENQLKSILTTATNHSPATSKICIAYEPLWSIGTGIIPDLDHLTKVFSFIHHYTKEHIPYIETVLLYGGSVSDENIDQLRSKSFCNGFLIGSASGDVQKLKKIVSSR